MVYSDDEDFEGGRVIRRHRKSHKKSVRKSHRKSRKSSITRRRRSRRGGAAAAPSLKTRLSTFGQGLSNGFHRLSASAKKTSEKFKNWINKK